MNVRSLLLAALSIVMACVYTPAAYAANPLGDDLPIHVGKVTLWQHPGGAPAFKTRAAAMAARREIFTKMGYAPELVELAMKITDETPGKVMIITGNVFDHQFYRNRQGQLVMETNVEADFRGKQPPGIPVSTGGPFLWAEVWQVVWHGNTYQIYLPYICFNWSDKMKLGPKLALAPPPIECAQIHFKAMKGQEVHIANAGSHNYTPNVCGPALKAPSMDHFVYDVGDWCHRQRCDFVDTINNLRREGHDVHLLDGSVISFIAAETGEYIYQQPVDVEEKNSDIVTILCLIATNGLQSRSRYITWTAYVKEDAYLVFLPSEVAMFAPSVDPATLDPYLFKPNDSTWKGLNHTWEFKPWTGSD